MIDLPGLLHQLNLEHYEDCFQREEVDLATFLTMTEEDLKEVGVTTVGARRKLSLAISGVQHIVSIFIYYHICMRDII